MRGFRDRCQTMDTFAGTASRSGQRVVNSVVALEKDFVMFSFDISQAFAQGMTFEEISKTTGTDLREVEFDLSPHDLPVPRQLPVYHDFDPIRETLKMLNPRSGLKGAPRARRQRRHTVLTEWGYGSVDRGG